MLSGHEAFYVCTHAWVPEHLVDYVATVSGKEAFLVGDFVCYRGQGVVLVVGYPLGQTFEIHELIETLEHIKKEIRPSRLFLIAPEIPSWEGLRPTGASDSYFRLDLVGFRPSPKVQNMLRRASRELDVLESSQAGKEHEALLEEFLASKRLSGESQRILKALPRYVEEVAGSILFDAYDKKGRLASFCVGQMGAGDWAFYMFHVNSPYLRVPGSSDLVLGAFLNKAMEQKKRFVNLGLGVNPGVSFFKKKWGASSFVDYKEASVFWGSWRCTIEWFSQGRRASSDVES